MEIHFECRRSKKRLHSYIKEDETIKRIRVLKRSSSKRVQTVEIHTSKRRKIKIDGASFRQAIDVTALKSLNFSMKTVSTTNKKTQDIQKGVSFLGYGYGHGVGLCQWGAKNMAEQGYNAKAILRFIIKIPKSVN